MIFLENFCKFIIQNKQCEPRGRHIGGRSLMAIQRQILRPQTTMKLLFQLPQLILGSTLLGINVKLI